MPCGFASAVLGTVAESKAQTVAALHEQGSALSRIEGGGKWMLMRLDCTPVGGEKLKGGSDGGFPLCGIKLCGLSVGNVTNVGELLVGRMPDERGMWKVEGGRWREEGGGWKDCHLL